jgi:hypothetical protein
MIGDLKPDVLLLDLHMAEKRAFTLQLVKSQLACVCYQGFPRGLKKGAPCQAGEGSVEIFRIAPARDSADKSP